MKSADETRLDPAVVAALYVEHADELRCFVLGVLRNADLATEVLQATFVKAIEQGHTARQETQKGWLFRVAFNEAMALKRKAAIHERATHKISQENNLSDDSPDTEAIRWETVTHVRQALKSLPPEQQQVVRMRMYEQKKFIEIAQELELPLGTVLTRMQLALKKLRERMKGFD